MKEELARTTFLNVWTKHEEEMFSSDRSNITYIVKFLFIFLKIGKFQLC